MRRLMLFLAAVTISSAAGCGSSATDYATQTRVATAALRSTIREYNQSKPTDVVTTARTCRTARDRLRTDATLDSPPPSGRYQRVGDDLQHAYQLALAGFSDCALANAMDYLRLYRASSEIDAANSWLAASRIHDPTPKP